MKNIRMLEWLAIAAALAWVIYLVAPHQLEVTAYKLSLITAAAVAGYWIDRSLFPYARPDRFLPPSVGVDSYSIALAFAAAMLRRALVIAACVIGVALGA